MTKPLEGNVTYSRPDSGSSFAGLYVLETQVEESIDAMPWLTDADKGLIELARQYARRIDNALRAADNEPEVAQLQVGATKALYLGPHLVNALKALGGDPGARLELEAKRKLATDADSTKEEDSIASFLRENEVRFRTRPSA